MPDTHKDSATSKKNQKEKYVLDPGIKRILLGGAGLLVILIVGTFFLQSGRIPFFTQNFLALVVLILIGIQAYIYSGQLRVMSVAYEPRLRIANVRVVNFQEGKRPAYIVTIVNEGATHAMGVRLHMRVREAVDRELNWIRDQV